MGGGGGLLVKPSYTGGGMQRFGQEKKRSSGKKQEVRARRGTGSNGRYGLVQGRRGWEGRGAER